MFALIKKAIESGFRAFLVSGLGVVAMSFDFAAKNFQPVGQPEDLIWSTLGVGLVAGLAKAIQKFIVLIKKG